MEAPERLRAWIERSAITQRMAAQILGVHYTFLNQILMGRRTPSLAIAVLIERHTGISPGAWVPTTDGKVTVSTGGDARKRKLA